MLAAAEKLAAGAARPAAATSSSATSRSRSRWTTATSTSRASSSTSGSCKGVPVRVELGPKDLAKKACVLARRDLPGKEGKEFGVPLAGGAGAHRRAARRRCRRTCSSGAQDVPRRQQHRGRTATTSSSRRSRSRAASCWAHWDGTRETEDRIAAETKATIRCIPFDRAEGGGQVHGDGPAVGGAGGVRPGVLKRISAGAAARAGGGSRPGLAPRSSGPSWCAACSRRPRIAEDNGVCRQAAGGRPQRLQRLVGG